MLRSFSFPVLSCIEYWMRFISFFVSFDTVHDSADAKFAQWRYFVFFFSPHRSWQPNMVLRMGPMHMSFVDSQMVLKSGASFHQPHRIQTSNDTLNSISHVHAIHGKTTMVNNSFRILRCHLSCGRHCSKCKCARFGFPRSLFSTFFQLPDLFSVHRSAYCQ